MTLVLDALSAVGRHHQILREGSRSYEVFWRSPWKPGARTFLSCMFLGFQETCLVLVVLVLT